MLRRIFNYVKVSENSFKLPFYRFEQHFSVIFISERALIQMLMYVLWIQERLNVKKIMPYTLYVGL